MSDEHCSHLEGRCMASTIAKLRADNARLRAALESLYAASEKGSAKNAIQDMLEIIDTALETSE